MHYFQYWCHLRLLTILETQVLHSLYVLCCLAGQCPRGRLIDTPGIELFTSLGLRHGYCGASAPDGSMWGCGHPITSQPRDYNFPTMTPQTDLWGKYTDCTSIVKTTIHHSDESCSALLQSSYGCAETYLPTGQLGASLNGRNIRTK